PIRELGPHEGSDFIVGHRRLRSDQIATAIPASASTISAASPTVTMYPSTSISLVACRMTSRKGLPPPRLPPRPVVSSEFLAILSARSTSNPKRSSILVIFPFSRRRTVLSQPALPHFAVLWTRYTCRASLTGKTSSL